LFDALLSDSIPITDHSILHDLKLPYDDDMDWLDNNVSKRLEKIADELLGEVSIILLQVEYVVLS